MEFVKTPSFWCPHIDRAVCTNFSTRTVKLRPSEHQEILPFSFSFPFLFSVLFFRFFLSSLYEFFLFFLCLRILFVLSLFPFLSFLAFLFLNISSHFIFSSFLFLVLFFSYSLFFGIFSPLWGILDRMVKGGNFLPLSSCHLCGP